MKRIARNIFRNQDDDYTNFKPQHTNIKELRGVSGNFRSPSKVVAFLYDLMRDHLPTGTVDELVRDTGDISSESQCLYTNGFLAQYAEYLAKKLTQ